MQGAMARMRDFRRQLFVASECNRDLCAARLGSDPFPRLVSALHAIVAKRSRTEGRMSQMKDQENAEVAATRNARITGERVWITPALSRSMAPLLSGLGIELLAPGERERATAPARNCWCA